jgi:hypothetical protein
MTHNAYLIIGKPNSGRTTLLRKLAPDAVMMRPEEISREAEGIRLFGTGKEVRKCTVCIDDGTNMCISDNTIELVVNDAVKIGTVYVVLQRSSDLRDRMDWGRYGCIYCMSESDTYLVPKEYQNKSVVCGRNHFKKMYEVPVGGSYDCFGEPVREDIEKMIVGKKAVITVECRYE